MYIPGKDLASLGSPFDLAKDSTNSLSLSFPLVVIAIAVSNNNQNHLAEVERRVAMEV